MWKTLTQIWTLLRAPAMGRDWLRFLPPRFVFRLLTWLGFTPPPMKALMDAGSFMLPQWMYVAARLELPERLAEKAMTAESLAEQTGVTAQRLGRLLYALEQRGYFRRCRPEPTDPHRGLWTNTPCSAALMAEHPNTIRPLVLHWMEDCYRPGGWLLESLRTDSCAFTLEHGPEHPTYFGDFLPANPDRERQFSEAMTASSAFSEGAVLSDYDWSRFSRIIDAGGSNGSFLQKALARYPNIRGLVFDLPNVVEKARTEWANQTRTPSTAVEFVAGDFFKADTIPPIAANEVVVLRNILHDWPDEACLAILSNLRQVMHADAQLVLIELGLGTNGRGHVLEQARSGIDMLMLSMFEGKERTPKELTELLERAGYTQIEVHQTRSIAQIWAARPGS